MKSLNLGKNVIILSSAAADLLFVLLSKYIYSGVPLSNFDFLYIGNILNISISAFLFFALILFITMKEKSGAIYFFVILFSIVYLLPLAAILFIKTSGVIFKGVYLGYEANKVFVAALYSINTLLKLFLIFILFSYARKRKLSLVKSFVNTIAVVFLLILFTVSYLFLFSKNNGKNKPDAGYDVAVILGAAVWHKNKPSTLFQGRIRKAIELHHKKRVNKIQVTGGRAPGEVTEAEAARNYLLKNGVPEKDILFEETTATTSEQIKFIKDNLIDFDGYDDIVVISDRFHLARVKQMSKFFGIKIDTLASDYSLNWEKLVYYSFRESVGLLIFWLYAI
ncbi:MAG: YdcF family protein [Chlorobi bacterium]|nr:YdcF family protein [Chlorobiota bacterium]